MGFPGIDGDNDNSSEVVVSMASGDGGSDNKDHLVYSYQPVAPCIDFKVGFPDPNHLPIQEVTDAFQGC